MTNRAAPLSDSKNIPHEIDVEISNYSLRAGELIFSITNRSRCFVREMLLIQLPRSGESIRDVDSNGKNSDSNSEILGETGLEPGQSLSVKVNLIQGEYALFINAIGLFMEMIWTSLTVTP